MIQVLNRALDILELLSRNMDKELTLSEIADPLELNHGTCANIIKTMIIRGYIEKNKGYTLGKQLYYLTNNFTNESEIIKWAVNPMKKLSSTLRECSIIAIIKNNSRITLHKETFAQELQVNALDEKHVYNTATGRLLLAYMEPTDRNAFIHTYGLPGAMWKEISNEKHLISELQQIKKNCYVLHCDDSNIVGVAVPVIGKKGVVASLGVYLPENRYVKLIKDALIGTLNETAQIISSRIIY
ncbi:IclR family transcriptional regulator [Sphingobacterium faecale]|uniref:Helix-turn-helix domain-containing protein n=1 Tax=Sphingobacterium faecale TaxID=2803775 RepID=A0ABS1R3Q2_9SPHI|nr:IclR family transcriptional regulator C-terminal domain-containing protein [Sphingobacterium faecale]MBL1409328.1 helix-turn-helix domain-containing protein [Sphingobacterium faecale]